MQCRCLRKPLCADHIVAYFTSRNGSPYQGLKNQRIIFEQRYTFEDQNNEFQIEPPIEYEDVSLQFCAIPLEWVQQDRIWPKECVNGTLAFVPKNPKNFNPASTPLACVRGDPNGCPSGKIGVWNNNINMFTCVSM